MNTVETIPGTKAVGQRWANAENNFIELCAEMGGFTKAESLHILAVFIKVKAVKLATGIGRYEFTHGAFVDVEVMRRALAIEVKAKDKK